ncbi:MAG TPA: hypothetical protein VEK34_07470 [Methylocella sp.]|nr:hypothetical protein [Methylocella sp.]
MNAILPPVPVIDAGEGGPLRHATLSRGRALALRDECLSVLPPALKRFLPVLDGSARRWLIRSGSPYVEEIAAIAAALGFPGVWLLNGSYQWGCTSLAREEDGVPWLARTLDWPFPGLGRHANVVRLKAPAGEYLSVTWPGYAGVLTAMAPGRFGAAINQAPMSRRTSHPWLRLLDVIANGLHTWVNIRYLPPDQLLRQVFETCKTYREARRMLEAIPVARPVIFILIGCVPGERCVIERTESDFLTREETTSAANDWIPARPKWEARMAASQFFTAPMNAAGERCRERHDALANWDGLLSRPGFEWLKPPVLNPYTRIAVSMSPARAALRVAGFEMRQSVFPEQVTQTCEV